MEGNIYNIHYFCPPMQSHEIEVKKTARYFTLGDPQGPEVDVWFVLHGYGQLGEFFIQNFESVVDDKTLVVAPEGLSRFYLGENKWKRVGASWMTKIDRLAEIRDQQAFLNQLYEQIMDRFKGKKVRFFLFGFSQGVATAWRWLKSSQIQPQHLIIWAGSVPEEMNPELKARLDQLTCWIVYGTQDEYIEEKDALERIEQFRSWIPKLEVICFEDRHRINEGALAELLQKIR